MSRYGKLAKNTTVFFIANFGSKILTLLLVRFYTELLSAEEYGIVDLLNTTASLALPIITLCITEAVLRFSIDDTDNRGKILTNGLVVMVLGNFAFMLMTPVLLQIDMLADNIVWIYMLTITNSVFAILAHFSRGIGKTKLFAVSGLIHTILQIGFNIVFLVFFSWGIKGYLLSSVLANVITAVFVFICGGLHKYIISKIDRKYLRVMLVYSIPLIPNSVFWWIMQSADRYVITYMLSAADNGLYAVANKIPTIITTISGIFFQAWQLSSVDEAKSDGKSIFYSRVFQMLSMVLISATSFIMVFLQPLYDILVEKSYYEGWRCTPFLLCAMIFSCYASFLGTNYVAMKKTKGLFLTTVVGAVVNIALNIILTPLIGIYGTALATVISFVLTWLVRAFDTRKFAKIEYPFITFVIPTVLVLGQAVLLTVGVTSMLLQGAIFLIIVALYTKTIIKLLKFILGRWKKNADRK